MQEGSDLMGDEGCFVREDTHLLCCTPVTLDILGRKSRLPTTFETQKKGIF